MRQVFGLVTATLLAGLGCQQSAVATFSPAPYANGIAGTEVRETKAAIDQAFAVVPKAAISGPAVAAFDLLGRTGAYNQGQSGQINYSFYRVPAEAQLFSPEPFAPLQDLQNRPASEEVLLRAMKPSRAHVEQIPFDTPVLAPMAHTRFCLAYKTDCRSPRIFFRGGGIKLTAERRAQLVSVNAAVNRSIKPERNNDGLAGEKWEISPKSGDCNDFAVTKRHELLAKGWPARVLLLAEVETSWGEHHLVLVIRTKDGDVVADNLSASIVPWIKPRYRWVRIQSPQNPVFWSSVASPAVVARLER
jgi:predicted transglutaminase-like cysteine proteinase